MKGTALRREGNYWVWGGVSLGLSEVGGMEEGSVHHDRRLGSDKESGLKGDDTFSN